MKMKWKHIILFVGIWLVAAACGGAPNAQEPASPEENVQLETIRLPMGFIPNVQYAPFYTAVEKGYFAEAGFEIDFDYSFETDGVALVGANEVPFAIVSGEQVLLARAQGLPVVYVMAWYQEYPIAVMSAQGEGILAPEDLAGKQIGLPGLFGASYIGLRALLNAGGIEEADVTLNSIGFNQVDLYVAGAADIIVGYANNEPIQLAALGYDVNIIPVSDYVQLAANGIITNEETIQNDPEMVRRFIQATIRGLQDAMDNPTQAFEISLSFIEALPEGAEEIQKMVLDKSIEYWQADTLGFSNPQAWENMQEVLLDMGLLAEPLDLNAAFTNEFIE